MQISKPVLSRHCLSVFNTLFLVITDHFTKFAQAYSTKNQTARTTADILYNQYIPYGIPKRLHSDQGANFESHLLSLCCLLGTKKFHTASYHPMGNSIT